MLRSLTRLSSVVAAVAILAGCGGTGSGAAVKHRTIGVVLSTTEISWFQTVLAGMKDAARVICDRVQPLDGRQFTPVVGASAGAGLSDGAGAAPAAKRRGETPLKPAGEDACAT